MKHASDHLSVLFPIHMIVPLKTLSTIENETKKAQKIAIEQTMLLQNYETNEVIRLKSNEILFHKVMSNGIPS